jgi:hypothetical protein
VTPPVPADRPYARRWRACCTLLTTVGVGLSMWEMSPVVSILAVALLTACAATVVSVVHMTRGERSGQALASRPVAVLGLRAGAGLMAVVTIVGASPSLGLLLGMVIIGTAPGVVLHRRPGGPRQPAQTGHADVLLRCADPVQPEEVAHLLEDLSDAELCRLWRSTFWELKSPHSEGECLTLVFLRQCCLDQLEKRDPAALEGWLTSGARASSSPEKFLQPPPP